MNRYFTTTLLAISVIFATLIVLDIRVTPKQNVTASDFTERQPFKSFYTHPKEFFPWYRDNYLIDMFDDSKISQEQLVDADFNENYFNLYSSWLSEILSRFLEFSEKEMKKAGNVRSFARQLNKLDFDCTTSGVMLQNMEITICKGLSRHGLEKTVDPAHHPYNPENTWGVRVYEWTVIALSDNRKTPVLRVAMRPVGFNEIQQLVFRDELLDRLIQKGSIYLKMK